MRERLEEAMIKVAVKTKMTLEKFVSSRDGDTNFISIIIILGIVILLVIVFRGYISQILAKVGGQVSQFFSGEGSGGF
jgi:ABC-type polysaccharide transport system permease subunit